jgi:hypothetical protein
MQDKVNKQTTTFNAEPHVVVSKTGNSLVVEAPSGAQYSRNTSHVKKFVTASEPLPRGEEGHTEEPVNMEVSLPASMEKATSDVVCLTPCQPRPQRDRKMPAKFEDFVL